ncbi:tRNA lysidine(34) synthetase TilS [Arthrobacter parietis]|uniref:tRNA(Ile)-lysidine synthase n=2 Tax=Arthrobacter TaxID=1663 RepID=A0ABT6CY32_9MICC|nr:tRNA lysidine(34) synthetase TilS [Arthrobacter vasquezii]MDF9278995.1 tRNA lysidine(34) synthetase TilS [Arthrobacter vasquezii]
MSRRPRLSPTVGTARNLIRAALEDAQVSEGSLILVACSGGTDSLALAVTAAYFAQTGQYRVGAVVVDHGLQQGSADVAEAARSQLAALGLAPVEVRRVEVATAGMGPEAAARIARYGALDAAVEQHRAAAVLLGHTLDDQAEQVLLGLSRGSGTRSLSGMPPRRGVYLRPFLALRRIQTEEICRFTGLDPWHDPTNADPSLMRSRVRTRVLPFLEDELGPGIAESLYRTSRILSQDAAYLDELAEVEYGRLRKTAGSSEPGKEEHDGGSLLLSEEGLRALPPALRQRVLALAVVELGGIQPSFERLLAAENLLRRTGSAGPVQLGGSVSAYRQVRGAGVPQGHSSYGSLVLRKNLTIRE